MVGTQGGIRVLVVDDHSRVRRAVLSLLDEQEGIAVVGEARDGIEAEERAAALDPDVVLMDVSMPRRNGIEATRRIKGRHPELVVIGFSVHEEKAVADAMRDAGATAFLLKGGDVEALVAAIRGPHEVTDRTARDS